MSLEGELTVRLAWDGRRVRQVTIRSSRPFAIARVVANRTPSEAMALVPRLFSICAGAQGAAAASALDAASARATPLVRRHARETAALVEAVQEHFWRLLIDWPQAMGHASAPAPVAAVRALVAPVLANAVAVDPPAADARARDELARALDPLARDHLYAMEPAAWLALSDAMALERWTASRATLPACLLGELLAHAPRLGASDIGLMPPATPEALAAALAPALERDPAFARAPHWNGVAVETGALARQQAHPLVAALRARDGNTAAVRMVARLVELAALLSRLHAGDVPTDDAPAVRSIALADGVGLAAADTARGLLVHRARIAAGRIAAYDIVAPTEWNFHPEGPLARGLAALAAADEAELVRSTRIAVHALDPCVACRVEVAHA